MPGRRRSKPSGAGARARASTSRCRAAAAGSAREHPVTRWSTRSSGSSASSASPWPPAPRSRPSGTTSSRSTSRPTIRRWTCTTRSTSTRRRPRASRRAAAAADPHLAGADPDDAGGAAAGPGGDPRHGLPQRRHGRLAPAGVLADRGAGGGRGDLVRGSQGHADPLRPSVLLAQRRRRGSGRRSSRSPSPPPRWTSSASSATGAAARRARERAGWRSWAAAWCTRRCSRTCISIRSATPGGRSGWGRTGSRCCATACRISGCCCDGDMRFSGSRRRDRAAGPGSRMNISLRWLEAFLRRDLDAADVTDAPHHARRAGRRRRAAPRRAGAVRRRPVVEVGAASRSQGHRLRLARWTTAPASRWHVVCGAPNVDGGARAIRSPGSGTRCPEGFRIEARKIRGSRRPGDALLRARARPRRGARRHPRARHRRRARDAAARGAAARRHRLVWTSPPTGPTSWATRASRASSRRRTGRRSACRRSRRAEPIDVPPARRAGASDAVGGVRISHRGRSSRARGSTPR